MTLALAFPIDWPEPFGLVMIEAMACGTPVIAYGKGGSLETVKGGETGVFFGAQTVESIQEAVHRFETLTFDPAAIRAHAERFSAPRFRSEFSRFAGERYAAFVEARR